MLDKKEFEIPSEKFKKGATVYTDSDTPVKAAIIYFHGGGLLYGRRKDLPRPHLNTLTQAGYAIIAFDYPLAPAAKLEMIMNDVESSIQYYIDHSDELIKNPKSSEGSLPYFLWGRSAGAYLCLIAAAKGTYTHAPAGILSYYGYGFYATTGSRNQADITARFRKFQKVLFVLFQKAFTQMAILTHTTVSMSMQDSKETG